MIPETQEAKNVFPDYPARNAQADTGRYLTHSPQCWFSRGTAHIFFLQTSVFEFYFYSIFFLIILV